MERDGARRTHMFHEVIVGNFFFSRVWCGFLLHSRAFRAPRCQGSYLRECEGMSVVLGYE